MRGPKVTGWKPPQDHSKAARWLCHTGLGMFNLKATDWPREGERVKDSKGRVYQMTDCGNLVRVSS